MGAGVRPALAVAELGERLLGDSRRLVPPAVGEARPGRLDGDAPAQRRLGIDGHRHGPVDVASPPRRPAQRLGGRSPQEQQRRLAVGDRAEAGEQAEHLARLDGVGDRLAEAHHHVRRSLVLTGVEQQPDGLQRSPALEQLLGELRCRLRIDRAPPERRRRGQVEGAGDLTPQRDAGGDRPIDEPGAAELVEEVAVDAGCPGEQGRRRPARGRRAVARPPRWQTRTMRDATAIGSADGSRWVWSSDVAMTRTLPSAASTIRRASVIEWAGSWSATSSGSTASAVASMMSPSTRWVASCIASARMRPAIINRHSPGGVLDALDEQFDVGSATSRWPSSMTTRRRRLGRCRQRAELAAQPQDILSRGAPHEPRLAVPGRRLEEDDRGEVGGREPAEQWGAGQTHGVSLSSLLMPATQGFCGHAASDVLLPLSGRRCTFSVLWVRWSP